jgi:hypothetical protein
VVDDEGVDGDLFGLELEADRSAGRRQLYRGELSSCAGAAAQRTLCNRADVSGFASLMPWLLVKGVDRAGWARKQAGVEGAGLAVE